LRAALTDLVDGWLVDLLAAAGVDDVALVALGGYGRREPAPGSDLDLVLVHRGRANVDTVADALWYPIWDAGMRLDHSVRTVAESEAVADTDLKVALGLLDGRHVAGDPSLTGEAVARIRAAWRRQAARRLPELAAAAADRAAGFGELAFLLEPDVKEARGGLRDVQAMRAVAAAWVSDPPSPSVLQAFSSLLDVRGELHRRTGRSTDRLVLQEQDGVAAALGYPDADELMRVVSAAGRQIAYAVDGCWHRVSALTADRGSRWRRGRTAVRRPLADGVVEQDGEVQLARDAEPASDAALPLRVAAAAADRGLPISRHALDRLSAAPPVPVPWPEDARHSLLALLGAGAGAVPVIEALDQHGLFVRWLPEWAEVRSRPQRNAYHRFTVDRHLVETAAEAAALMPRVARPDLLLLAALLHDLGKGRSGDHSVVGAALAEEVTGRLGLPAADRAVVARLVRQHLLLADTATRRDLDDPATVAQVAAAVGDRDTLELLHALTEADGRATGPAAWGDWKARLVAALADRTSAVLAGAPAPRALELTASQRALAQAGELAVAVEDDTVTVVAPDRPGLLWRWAGVLALHRLEVRSASATPVGRTAVTVLQVRPRYGSPPDWDLVRADIRSAYQDTLPLAERLAERERSYTRTTGRVPAARVLFVDDASEQATVVEVRAHDRIGLLYRITHALADNGLDVRQARVTTLGVEAVDAFYVVDADGRPVTDSRRRADVEQAVLAAVNPGGAPG
jgi:[protein-PII] uridylyltransferase